jgi:excinuclease UvrABC nuclease subunit
MKFDEMQKIYNLCKCNFVPSDEFLTMHIPELPGVYIHHNITKNIYYVGQAKNLNRRCKKHLTGYGNGDVYADKKYGDKFESAIVLLGDTDMSLNELERLYIKKYHASIDGYNRTEGNNG